MRGRHQAVQPPPRQRGNTPAYAGKTQSAYGCTCPDRKHPRVCGEDKMALSSSESHSETPPRMRGRPRQACPLDLDTGNTPAYAGKTSYASDPCTHARKHPRVCGEDSMASIASMAPWETPPRMRGRQNLTASPSGEQGNTPAYAGKTSPVTTNEISRRKHPRVCGEDPAYCVKSSPVTETPPRMRGRPAYSTGFLVTARNTPAYAGKTRAPLMVLRSREKHPRVCGEDWLHQARTPPRRETPPRMRGRLQYAEPDSRWNRNTPAYAGKTGTPEGVLDAR